MQRRYFSLFFYGPSCIDNGVSAKLVTESPDKTIQSVDERAVKLEGPLSASLPAKIAELVNGGFDFVGLTIVNGDKRAYNNGDRDATEENYTFDLCDRGDLAAALACLARCFGDVRGGRRVVSVIVEWHTNDDDETPKQ